VDSNKGSPNLSFTTETVVLIPQNGWGASCWFFNNSTSPSVYCKPMICHWLKRVTTNRHVVTVWYWSHVGFYITFRGLQVFSNILDQLLKCQTQAQTDTLARVVTDYVNQVQVCNIHQCMSCYWSCCCVLCCLNEDVNIAASDVENITNFICN